MFYVSFLVQKLIHNISFWFRAVYYVRFDIMFKTLFKNAAKRRRQHAGEKYWEYAQRSVCFVNKQVP